MTDIAFLGTGMMGLPMACNLLEAGFTVHAWNRTADRAQPLADAGAELFEDPAAAADGCPLMVTMLSDVDSVLEVGAAALAASDPPEVWIQMSTIGVAGAERCAELADDRDVTYVDAPVLGTRAPAEQGTLVILGSGPESACPAVDPVFAAIGARTLWLGEAGAGTAAKVVVNSWVVGIVAVLAETMGLAQTLGVDPQVFFDAIEGGPLDLPYARHKGGAMVKRAFHDVSFRLALARKDTDLVLAAAADAGLELPVMEGALARMRAAEADGHGDEDMAAMYWPGAPPDVEKASKTVPESAFEREQEQAAAAEAAAIGGHVSDEPPMVDDLEADPAQRPLIEAGEGEAEGFELAERELQEHATHSDQHAARRVLQDAEGFHEDPRAADGGEADQERTEPQ